MRVDLPGRCKAKLARDPNCCVDSARAPTVHMEEHLLTPWTCEAPGCFDKPNQPPQPTGQECNGRQGESAGDTISEQDGVEHTPEK